MKLRHALLASTFTPTLFSLIACDDADGANDATGGSAAALDGAGGGALNNGTGAATSTGGSARGSGGVVGSDNTTGGIGNTGGRNGGTGGSSNSSGGTDRGAGGSESSGGSNTAPSGVSYTELTEVEIPGLACSVAKMPSFDALVENEKLPNPFTMIDGTPVTSREEWVCRHREIRELVEIYETGPKSLHHDTTTVTGSSSGNSFTVSVSGGAQDVSFDVSITLPSTGTAPYPAMIGLSGGSLSSQKLQQMGVATINYNMSDVQPEGNRSGGVFSTFQGEANTGSLMSWAWGVSRLIDALESTPDAQIDPKHLGVTGCSRLGKGAIMIGAMDSRIALTIPQESGSGGVAAWRVSEVDNAGRTGSSGVQELKRTYTETNWFGPMIEPFANAVTKLPLDHHELVAMGAPRGMLLLGNTNYEWLSTNNSDQSGGAARIVYDALGVKENIGYIDSGHGHCGTDYAGREQAAIDAFVQRFLLEDTSVSTDFWDVTNDLDTDQWVDWTAPDLSN